MNPRPKIGTCWRLKARPEELYVIFAITNERMGNPDYPLSVVYTDWSGNFHNRPIEGWHDSYEEVEDYFNYMETKKLEACAIAVQLNIDRLAQEFREARIDALRRKQLND